MQAGPGPFWSLEEIYVTQYSIVQNKKNLMWFLVKNACPNFNVKFPTLKISYLIPLSSQVLNYNSFALYTYCKTCCFSIETNPHKMNFGYSKQQVTTLFKILYRLLVSK